MNTTHCEISEHTRGVLSIVGSNLFVLAEAQRRYKVVLDSGRASSGGIN